MNQIKKGSGIFLRVFIISFLIISLHSSCCKTQPAVVVVREADFRLGPILLPLDENTTKEVIEFLKKNGDKEQDNITNPEASKKYGSWLELLNKKEFLKESKFKKPGTNNKISTTLEKWFSNPIVYQLVDATKKRPPKRNPISVSDGYYWWIFYRMKKNEEENDFDITGLMITQRIFKKVDHYK